MLAFDSISVSSYDLSNFTVSWELAFTVETVSGYGANIYRSDNPEFDAEDSALVISGLALQLYDYYTDYTISGLDNSQWSYRNYFLEIENLSTHVKSAMYGPYKAETERDLTAKNIIADKNIGLRSKYGGKPLLLLKRKTNGGRCSCFDDTLGKQSEENCSECYDTSWQGGYWTPIQFQGMINAAPNRTQITEWGLWETSDVILLTTNFPKLSPRDVIVDKNNRRWLIVQVRPIERGLYIITQQAQLRLINKSDVIYSFSVSWS